MKELMTLSTRELHRLKILEQVMNGTLSLVKGAKVLNVSYRHSKRLLFRYRREGPCGLAHRRRKKPAHNAYGQGVRERVLTIHQ